jgi:sulfur carrier protein
VITVNGEQRDPAATVAALLADTEGVPDDCRGVAVAIDGQVVPRSAWDDTAVPDGARVEILTAVQGG